MKIPSIKSFADVHKALEPFIPLARTPEAYRLDRMLLLMAALGNPQNSFRAIHVAGTSGKTSTAYYAASLLLQSGKKVGLTVSPHIDEINERVQLQLQPLPERQFCAYFARFLEKIKEVEKQPTYFELMIAFAYWVFAEEQVDYAVIEVGMGGLLDSTNVLGRADKVCIITDIGYDHMHILGRSLPEIAAQKAGIIKPFNRVFMYLQDAKVMEVVREVSRQQQTELHEIRSLRSSGLPANLPLFQRRNWYLALRACQYIFERDGMPVLNEMQLALSTSAYIPARMEVQYVGNKIVIMDGAHNPQKMQALAKSLTAAYPGKKFAILLGLVQSRTSRAAGVLKAVAPIADSITLTGFEIEHGLQKVSVSPGKLAGQLRRLNYDKWRVIDDPALALRALLNGDDEIIVVTGSFYLMDYIRRALP